MRDTQRTRLYASERATANVLELDRGHEFGWGSPSLPTLEAQAYINHVMRSNWLRNRYAGSIPTFRVTIEHRPQAHRGRASRGTQTIYTAGKNPRSSTARYLLHELAHILEATDEASHGPTFCMIYLELVRHFLGKETHDVLKAQMLALKLRIKPKAKRAKRVLTEEQREVLRERLAKARETKRAKALLARAEAEHQKRLALYHAAWSHSQNASTPEDRQDWARQAECYREDANRLWDRIGTVKYTMAKAANLTQ